MISKLLLGILSIDFIRSPEKADELSTDDKCSTRGIPDVKPGTGATSTSASSIRCASEKVPSLYISQDSCTSSVILSSTRCPIAAHNHKGEVITILRKHETSL